MKAKVIFGENHNGKLVNPKVNCVLLGKIEAQLGRLMKRNKIVWYQLNGRVKDAGMLKGKISRCVTADDFKTIPFEEIGFRFVFLSKKDFLKANKLLSKGASFGKDYYKNPREDAKILGSNKDLAYRAIHIYTAKFCNKPIEIQLMTKQILDEANELAEIFGKGYWKKEDYRKKREARQKLEQRMLERQLGLDD